MCVSIRWSTSVGLLTRHYGYLLNGAALTTIHNLRLSKNLKKTKKQKKKKKKKTDDITVFVLKIDIFKAFYVGVLTLT